MSMEEWDDLPWWLARTYIDGFHQEGILGDGKNTTPRGGGSPASATPPPVDLTSADLAEIPRGFTVRRAG